MLSFTWEQCWWLNTEHVFPAPRRFYPYPSLLGTAIIMTMCELTSSHGVITIQQQWACLYFSNASRFSRETGIRERIQRWSNYLRELSNNRIFNFCSLTKWLRYPTFKAIFHIQNTGCRYTFLHVHRNNKTACPTSTHIQIISKSNWS